MAQEANQRLDGNRRDHAARGSTRHLVSAENSLRPRRARTERFAVAAAPSCHPLLRRGCHTSHGLAATLPLPCRCGDALHVRHPPFFPSCRPVCGRVRGARRRCSR
eukprot:scaffold93064_cov104-Phaeocystis_antarctica.AAC.3